MPAQAPGEIKKAEECAEIVLFTRGLSPPFPPFSSQTRTPLHPSSLSGTTAELLASRADGVCFGGILF